MQVSESEVHVCSIGCKKTDFFCNGFVLPKNKYLRFLDKPALVL